LLKCVLDLVHEDPNEVTPRRSSPPVFGTGTDDVDAVVRVGERRSSFVFDA
jgi:hypothetical protein